MKDTFKDEEIVPVVYEAMRMLDLLQNELTPEDPDTEHWEELDSFDKIEIGEQLLAVVRKIRAGMPAEQIHDEWCTEARNSGWRYGPKLSAENGTDSRLVAWDKLAPEDKRQVALFVAIVNALPA